MKKDLFKSEHRRSSRREFLRKSGSVATVSALAGLASPRVHAAEKNTIKLALVGCGGRGTGAVANALTAENGPVELHAMADVFEQRLQGSLQTLSKRFPDRIDVPEERRFLGFDAYRKAIDSLDPGDVVLLTTHAAFRPMMLEYAVEKGVNVFAEKSFATDPVNVRRWMKAAKASEEKNLKVGVGFMWRHSRARQEAIRRIHDGEIGDLHTLRIYRVHGPVFTPPRPKDANEMEFQIRYGSRFNWISSGFFIDWHCHNVDVACWTKGAWPTTAQAMGGRCYDRAGNLFDHYAVEYTFDDGTKLFAFTRHMNNCWNTYSDYAHGTKGSAVLMESLSRPLPKIYKTQKMVPENVVWEFGEREKNPYVVEWDVLLDAIRNDKKHNEAVRAGEAEVAAIMGRAAAHTGKMVTWDEVIASDFQYIDDIDHLDFQTEPPIHDNDEGIYPAPQPGQTEEL
jgi:predicted dehydrogenase